MESEEDPVVDIVKSMMRRYPEVKAKLCVGGRHDWGVNPKLCNLGSGYGMAKYDLLWIADANIAASDVVLLDLIEKAQMSDRVALVHQIPWMISGPSARKGVYQTGMEVMNGSTLDRWYFATGHARLYLNINVSMRLACVNGMSVLLKRSIFDANFDGGLLRHFAQYIAEDAEFGFQLIERGYRVVLASHAAVQNLAETSLHAFVSRRVRWKKLTYNLPSIASSVCFEWIVDASFSGAVMSVALARHMGWNAALAVAVYFAYWVTCDAIMFRVVSLDAAVALPRYWQGNMERGSSTAMGVFRHLSLWLIRSSQRFGSRSWQ